jgi:hypothetical protein
MLDTADEFTKILWNIGTLSLDAGKNDIELQIFFLTNSRENASRGKKSYKLFSLQY